MNTKKLQCLIVGAMFLGINLGTVVTVYGESFIVTKAGSTKSSSTTTTSTKAVGTKATSTTSKSKVSSTITKAKSTNSSTKSKVKSKKDTKSTKVTKNTKQGTIKPKSSTSITNSSAVKQGTTPNIRVLLGSRKSPTTIKSGTNMTVFKGDDQKVSVIVAGSTGKLSVSGNTIYVNGKAIGPNVLIKPQNPKESFYLGDKQYRGGLRVFAVGRSSTMTLVNAIPLEDYLYGVVPQEVIPSWPAAALEAQAVAARTYALYTMETNKNKDYDVKPSTDYQMYAGRAGEHNATTVAVDKTKGMVMFYNQKPINALFHSDGGGYTEDSVNVWGTALPYLKGVKDYSQAPSTRTWTVTTTRQAMEANLRAAGKGVGTLKSIQLTPLKAQPMETADRGVSGRVKSATFIGSDGKVTVDGDALRSIFGLKSTLFDFYVNHNPNGKDSAKPYHTFTNKNDTVYILGHGWGHGLGLSQWGAAEMAKQNGDKDQEYYKKILTHYYSGININKMY